MPRYPAFVHPRRAAAAAMAILAVVGLAACTPADDSTVEPAPAAIETAAPPADTRIAALPDEAYALSLPELDAWLAEDFDNAWIVVATTLGHTADALHAAAADPAEYAVWVGRFESVVAIADAVTDGDDDAARAALEPLLTEAPEARAHVHLVTTLTPQPYAAAEASLAVLDEAIAAEDRDAARQAAADAAANLTHVVRSAQAEVPAGDAALVLGKLLPAFHAIDAVQDAVVDGQARDAAEGAAALHAAFDDFHAWYRTETP